MIVGLFPPSSISIFRGPAAAVILAAVAGPPVNETRAIRSSVTSDCPAWARPQTTATRRAGTPAASRSSTSARAVSGVWSEGLSTTPLPAISAGPSLCATRLSGSLKEVSAATTPTGSRVNQPTRFRPFLLAANGIVCPLRCVPASADRRSVSTPRATSRSASPIVFTPSDAMRWANRAAPSSRSRAALCRHSLRAHNGHSSVESDSWTPDTAAATSAGVESAT